MFERLKRRIRGVLSFDEMARRSEEQIERALGSDEKDIALQQLDANLEWFEAWREEHHKMLCRIAQCSSRGEQAIAIRRETLRSIENSISTKPLLFDDFDESEGRLLAKALHPDRSYEEVLTADMQLFVYSQASSLCLRMLSFELGDARKNDWFTMYCDVYEQLVEHLYRDIIAQTKGDIYALPPLATLAKKMADEAKEKVLQGNNWDYDKEAMERDRLSEKDREQEDEPPLQRTVTNHQVKELTEFLVERVGRAQRGELYKIDDYAPTDLAKVHSISKCDMPIKTKASPWRFLDVALLFATHPFR
ncbi:hypothetical protein, partial [Sinorhizobium meliloti]|uniref:hypothetical protein n=1 Tax=Rhizobium meliloti TaxID=382 RepID=UPI000FE0A28C